MRVSACVHACVRVCMRVCARVCVCVRAFVRVCAKEGKLAGGLSGGITEQGAELQLPIEAADAAASCAPRPRRRWASTGLPQRSFGCGPSLLPLDLPGRRRPHGASSRLHAACCTLRAAFGKASVALLFAVLLNGCMLCVTCCLLSVACYFLRRMLRVPRCVVRAQQGCMLHWCIMHVA